MHVLETGRVRGVVFDLWNTLAFDPHRPNPFVALVDAYGLRDDPGILERAIMCQELSGIEEAIAVLARVTHRTLDPLQGEALARIWRNAGERVRLFPDVEEALSRLAGRFRLGLLSNTQSFGLEFLDSLGPIFQARLFSYELGVLKPDPAMFSQIAERLRLAPRHLLMVGDHLRDDVLGAEAAGWQALLLRRSNAPLSFRERDLDRRPLESLLELIDLLLPRRTS